MQFDGATSAKTASQRVLMSLRHAGYYEKLSLATVLFLLT